MCELTTLMLASAVASGLGQFQQASAQSANAKFQQQIAMENSKIAAEQMRDANERGADEERQVRAEGARTLANTRGALAANNMDLTFGSPLDTIHEVVKETERDAYRVRRNTSYEVRDLELKKYNYRNQSHAYGAESKNAMTAGMVAGVGTALSGGAEIYKYKASIT